jgi:proteasome-associated ATPase
MNSTGGGIFFPMSVGWGPAMTREQQLEEETKRLRARIAEFSEQAVGFGVVVQVHDGRMTLNLGGGQVVERALPPWAKDAKVGMTVQVTAQGCTPIRFTEGPPGQGTIVTVERVHGDLIEYQSMGAARISARGPGECKPGDRVILNAGMDVVVRNLGPGGTAKVHTAETGVRWDDIGGCAEAKRLMREAIEEPVEQKEIYARFGKRPCRGIALWGPSGTGKTMLAKAAATALAETHGASARESGFIYCKGPDLLSFMQGESESRVRQLFASARAHRAKEGYPAIIFLDEADGILMRRGSRFGLEGGERTIVPQFLAEMDGFDESGSMVILATNRLQALDPAFLRDGRIDRKIEVRRPNDAECEDIFAKHLRGRPTEGKPKALAAAGVKHLFAEGHALYVVRTKDGKGDTRLTLGKLASGALVAGVVERATQIAIRRAVAEGDAKGGLREDDFREAVAEVLVEQRALAHAEDVEAMIDSIGRENVKSVDRAA